MQSGPIMHLGIGPHAGRALLGELGAGVALALTPGLVRLAALVPGGTAALLQARGAPARTREDARAGDERRLPVEDDAAGVVADDHLGTGDGAGLEQLVLDAEAPQPAGQAADGAALEQRVLDAEARQPVGEVADGLVVAEVGLPDPPLGLLAAHPEADP